MCERCERCANYVNNVNKTKYVQHCERRDIYVKNVTDVLKCKRCDKYVNIETYVLKCEWWDIYVNNVKYVLNMWLMWKISLLSNYRFEMQIMFAHCFLDWYLNDFNPNYKKKSINLSFTWINWTFFFAIPKHKTIINCFEVHWHTLLYYLYIFKAKHFFFILYIKSTLNLFDLNNYLVVVLMSLKVWLINCFFLSNDK